MVLFGIERKSMIEVRNNEKYLTKHFREREFHTLGHGDVQLIDGRIPKMMEAMRQYYDVPIIITSVYRSGNNQSYHGLGKAVDFQFYKSDMSGIDWNIHTRMYHDMASHTGIWLLLYQMGVRGFGRYNRHFHLDYREENISLKENGKEYAEWEAISQ